MNRIRKLFAAEVEAMAPVLHETYRRVGIYQKARSPRNEARLLAQFREVAPHLEFFRPEVPGPKQAYFVALADEGLPVSDRIIALDVAVGALHIAFPVERAYMHQESARLRAVLEAARWTDDPPALEPTTELATGVGASPGVVTGAAHVATRTSDFRRIPEGAVLVTTMPRPELTPTLVTQGVVAIVAEQGGMLCHAAIVARELGIPCVVGAARATKRVRSGDRVTVDGGRGIVTRPDGER